MSLVFVHSLTLEFNTKLSDDGKLEERKAHLSSAASRLCCELGDVGRGEAEEEGREGMGWQVRGAERHKEFGWNGAVFALSSVIELGRGERTEEGAGRRAIGRCVGISKELEEGRNKDES